MSPPDSTPESIREKDLVQEPQQNEVNPSGGYLITRVIRAIIPRRFIYAEEDQLPSSRSPQGVFERIYDWLFFTQAFSLLWASAGGRSLREDDFAPVPQALGATTRLEGFHRAFEHYRARQDLSDATDEDKAMQIQQSNGKLAILGALCSVFCRPFMISIGLQFVATAILICQVLLYRELLYYLIPLYRRESEEAINGHTLARGVGIIAAMATSAAVSGILTARSKYASEMVAAEARTLLSIVLATKSLSLSEYAPRQIDLEIDAAGSPTWTPASILNLANTDTERIYIALKYFNVIWPPILFAPLIGGISFWLVGWRAWAGVGLLYCLLATAFPVLIWLKRVRSKTNVQTEKRVNSVYDLVNGVYILKAFCWEDCFINVVRGIRALETKLNYTKVMINSTIIMISVQSGRLAPVLIVGLYSINHTMSLSDTPALLCIVFMFYVISQVMYEIPICVFYCVDAWESIGRMASYLCTDDGFHSRADAFATSLPLNQENGSSEKTTDDLMQSISLLDAAFSRTSQPDAEEFSLSPVNMTIARGELIAVTGPTSSGKSTLAEGLAGRLLLLAGKASRNDPVIYAPTKPWIYSATIRQNILFGLDYDAEVYRSIIAACCLDADLATFADGDATSLGEKGVNLSGGQRARIGLARALYTAATTRLEDEQAGIIILDDPFSALDAATSSMVFENVVLKKMANFTRVIITHQVEFLSRCDRVAWLSRGTIEALGSFQTLMDSSPAFQKFVGHKQQIESDDRDTTSSELRRQMTTDLCQDTFHSDEELHSDQIPWKTISAYLNLSKTWPLLALLLLTFITSQVGNLLYHLQIVWWISRTYDLAQNNWPGIIMATIVIQAILWLITTQWTQRWLTAASMNLGNRATSAVLRAPTEFFDTTPLGRVIHRFTQVCLQIGLY